MARRPEMRHIGAPILSRRKRREDGDTRTGSDPSFQAQEAIGAGFGALITAMFGAGWLGWGLGQAGAFTGLRGPAFGFFELFLMACSIYAIRRGRLLSKRYPPVEAPTRRAWRRPYLIVVSVEVIGILLVSILANRLRRVDLAADWCAMVVGLHFLPLAKIFRTVYLGAIGGLMTLWCVLCWILFRSDALVISVTVGTGILLWAACVSALFRAGKIVHALQ
jgi:hypothetical protein